MDVFNNKHASITHWRVTGLDSQHTTMEGMEEGTSRKSSVVRFSVREQAAGQGQQRRSSIFAGRRKSSVSCFMDYEATTKAFLDSQVKLSQSARVLADLENKHKELQQSYEVLYARYLEVKNDALECTLRYSVEKSGDFKHLPRLNTDLLETETRVGDYAMGEIINKGQFSLVRRCAHCPPSASSSPTSRRQSQSLSASQQQQQQQPVLPLAIKIISKDNLTAISSVLGLESELRALSVLNHPNVIPLYECLHGTQNIYIVTAAVTSDLFEFVEQYQHVLDENICCCVLKDLAAALAHLQAHRVVHRDIKPENVLVEFTNHATRHNFITVKLCDFGLCSFVPETSSVLHGFAGSPGFFAPEVLLHSAYCGFRADVFSFAAVALEMLTPQSVFHSTWMSVYHHRARDAHFFSGAMRDAIVAVLKDLRKRHPVVDIQEVVCSALCLEASDRPPIDVIQRSTWLMSANHTAACDALNQKAKQTSSWRNVAGGAGRGACVKVLPGLGTPSPSSGSGGRQ